MATTNIVDKDGNTISASDATVPSDRHFRGAWTLSGTTISEDLATAKDIFKDKIREVRKPLLEAEDVIYMKALEADDATAKAASVTKKTNLRNAPAASAIADATTIAELKAAWDADLLGDSPYAQEQLMALTKIGKEGITGISNSSDANAITIDSSENVGIGTSSPDTNLDIERSSNDTGGIKVQNTNNSQGSAVAQVEISGGDNAYANLLLECNSTNHSIRQDGAGNLKFINASTERMRINSDGALCINRTNQANDERLAITGVTGEQCMSLTSPITTAYDMINIINGNGQVGSIQTNGTSTSYNTSSDYRLKENVTADWDATTRLKQLNPVRFNFIADADTTVDGFLAHEVQSVVPEAITGTHNEVDADGNPVYQGIDQSKLVPLLVKTIQELEARITALENS